MNTQPEIEKVVEILSKLESVLHNRLDGSDIADVLETMKSHLENALTEAEERGAKRNLEKVNRVEVIDHTSDYEDGGGRAYVYWSPKGGIEVTVDLQDEGKTMKVFIKPKELTD